MRSSRLFFCKSDVTNSLIVLGTTEGPRVGAKARSLNSKVFRTQRCDDWVVRWSLKGCLALFLFPIDFADLGGPIVAYKDIY